jgi:hypothetical protein
VQVSLTNSYCEPRSSSSSNCRRVAQRLTFELPLDGFWGIWTDSAPCRCFAENHLNTMKSSVAAVLLLALAGVQLAAGESYEASQYPWSSLRPASTPQESVHY